MEPQPSSGNVQQAYRVAYLVAGYLQQTLTAAEKAELDAWVEASDHNRQLFAELTDPAQLKAQATGFPVDKTEASLQHTRELIQARQRGRVRRLWIAGAAAAVAAAIAVLMVLRPFDQSAPGSQDLPIALTRPAPDWASWRQATLAYGDGREIPLGRTNQDTILAQGIMVKAGSTLVYGSSAAKAQHTVIVPAQSMYTIQLPDGTVVTLNAHSELRYPTQFTGNERKVELKGEGYFDVAKDSARPFRVETRVYPASTMTIEALGTVFNIDAHPADTRFITTLVEGKVKVQLDQQTPVLLHPNEAAYALAGGLHKTTVDASAAMAWTQHRFEFNDTPLMDVLRQLAYWYDIDFETTDPVPAIHLNVTFSRDEPIDSVLNLLSQTKAFKYNRRGQHITLTF